MTQTQFLGNLDGSKYLLFQGSRPPYGRPRRERSVGDTPRYFTYEARKGSYSVTTAPQDLANLHKLQAKASFVFSGKSDAVDVLDHCL